MDWVWHAVFSGPEAFQLPDGILFHPNETDTNQCDTIAAPCKDNLLWMEVLWLHIITHKRSNPWLSGTIRACSSTLSATTNCCAMWAIMACLRSEGNFVCGHARQWQGCCSWLRPAAFILSYCPFLPFVFPPLVNGFPISFNTLLCWNLHRTDAPLHRRQLM